MSVSSARRMPAERIAALVAGLLQEGWRVELAVTGGSMAPFIRSGDVLTLQRRPPRLGDVMARRDPAGRLVIHRVVGRHGADWLTRGDAGTRADLPAAAEDLLGTVLRVERLGAEVRLGLGRERFAIALLSGWGLLRPLLSPMRALARRSARASEERGDQVADLGVLAEVQFVEGGSGQHGLADRQRG